MTLSLWISGPERAAISLVQTRILAGKACSPMYTNVNVAVPNGAIVQHWKLLITIQ